MVSIAKICVLIFILAILSFNSPTRIEMDDESLERLGEMLIENYISNNLMPRETLRRSMWSKMSSFLVCVLQLIGVTVSLITANIFTPYFQTSLNSKVIPQSPRTAIKILSQPRYNNGTLSPGNLCPNDFGCDRNLCWRSCHHENDQPSWCYTRKPDSRAYAQCIEMSDCSPCWECLGHCHKK